MAIEYTFDPRLSRFTVQATATGMLSAFAHSPMFAVRDFKGTLRLTESEGNNSMTVQVIVTVAANTIELLDELSSKDRQEITRVMREQVLEISRYPEIRFESDAIPVNKTSATAYRLPLKGKLLLHGQSHDQEVNANLAILGDTIRVGGESVVRQSDYAIKRTKAAGGMIQTRDEVKVKYDLVGNVPRQSA